MGEKENEFLVLINQKPMQCTDGRIYTYQTTREAVRIVDICYGISSFKKTIKIKRYGKHFINAIS